MDRTAWVEVLDAHAEALQGQRGGVESLATASPRDRARLEQLFHLARRACGVLRPVEPRPEFVRSLRRRLTRQWPLALRPVPAAREPWLLPMLGLGGLLYVTAMAALSLRVLSTFTGVVALLLGLRLDKADQWKLRT